MATAGETNVELNEQMLTALLTLYGNQRAVSWLEAVEPTLLDQIGHAINTVQMAPKRPVNIYTEHLPDPVTAALEAAIELVYAYPDKGYGVGEQIASLREALEQLGTKFEDDDDSDDDDQDDDPPAGSQDLDQEIAWTADGDPVELR